MEFTLPGQLRGPECRRVMKHAISLRRSLEPWFASQQHASIEKTTIVLRVDGTLGSFGPAGVENINIESKELSCDLVIADQGWEELSDQQIVQVLMTEISSAVAICFDEHGISYSLNGLQLAMTKGP